MKMLQASDAARLAGLTMHQLREWCARRVLLAPDIPGAGRGRHALYSWQTVLALRLLLELQDRFGAEVGAWKPGIEEARQLLQRRSFPSLWNTAVVFLDCGHAQLSDERMVSTKGCLVLPLAAHLQAVAELLSIPAAQQQRSLFPAVGISQ